MRGVIYTDISGKKGKWLTGTSGMRYGDVSLLQDDDLEDALADGISVYEEAEAVADTNYTQMIAASVSTARRRAVEFADEVKLLEYADKAALAPRIIDGTASVEEISASLSDHWALTENITDIIVIADKWTELANVLRVKRNAINVLSANALAAISAGQDDPAEIVTELSADLELLHNA